MMPRGLFVALLIWVGLIVAFAVWLFGAPATGDDVVPSTESIQRFNAMAPDKTTDRSTLDFTVPRSPRAAQAVCVVDKRGIHRGQVWRTVSCKRYYRALYERVTGPDAGILMGCWLADPCSKAPLKRRTDEMPDIRYPEDTSQWWAVPDRLHPVHFLEADFR